MKDLTRLAFAGLILALAGCSPRQYFAQPASVEETRDMVRALKAEQEAIRERLLAIEAGLNRQEDAILQNRADMNAQLEALADNLRRISDRLQDLSGQVERRSRAVPPPSLYPPPVTPDVEPVPGGPEAAPDTGRSHQGEAAPDAPGVDPEQVYDQAYRDVTRGSYSLAIAGFQEFLNLYPDHPLADNAQYWLGECHYVQDDIGGAMTEFQKVLERHPDGDKVPAAYLKLGYCALRLNDREGARRNFSELIQKYPTSEEARSARAKLATLN